MGAGKDIGKALFGLAGKAVKAGTDFVGDVVGSEFIKEVGDTASRVSERTGELVGQAADGTAEAARGIYHGDDKRVSAGFDEAGQAVKQTVVGFGNAVGQAVSDGADVVRGLREDDSAAAADGLRRLARTGAVTLLSVGVLDALDIIDIGAEGVDAGDASADLQATDASDLPPAEVHFVEPHHVDGYITDDGTVVADYWRDGDGTAAVDRTADYGGGYFRSNPDGISSNNLGG